MAMSMTDRRIKYSGHTHTVNHTERKITRNIDIDTLNIMCSYVLSSNRNIRKGGYINLRNFIECLNLDIFKNELDKLSRIDFIKRGLDARLVKGISNPKLVLTHINGGLLDDNLINMECISELSNDEIEYLNEVVTGSLNFTFIDEEVDPLMDLLVRWKSGDYRSKADIALQIETLVNRLHNKFRQAKVERMDQITFALRPDKFDQAISDIYQKITDPSRCLITGMQGMNEILGGGFYASRIYMLLGITGVGKSLTLLNLIYQMKKHNKKYTPKDPTKRPCIVYLTMENDVYETVERLFTISTGLDMRDLTLEEVVKKAKTDGELFLSDDSPIDIIIKFLPDRSVDTSALYTICEDLEDDGYEVISFVLDHIKRIRSIYGNSDVRLELGAVVNECKTFATIKDLSFITDSHLNRDAAAIIEKNISGSKADLTRLLGKANIGESMLMLDNMDCGLIMNVETDTNEIKYMVFKRIKMRYKCSLRDYICEPFEETNSIRFVEDIGWAVPVFKDTLHDIDYNQVNVKTHMTTIKKSSYCNITDIDDALPNIKMSKYNINTVPDEMEEVKETKVYSTRYKKQDEIEREVNEVANKLKPIRFVYYSDNSPIKVLK